MAVEDAPEETTPASGVKSREELVVLLTRAWTRAGVNPDCELCGHAKWSVLMHDKHDGLALVMREGPNIKIPGVTYMVYGAECVNCGNVRQFNKSTIENLAAQNRESDADAEVAKAKPDE